MDYDVKYSVRKTVSIKVSMGRVIVSAPVGIKRKTLDDIIKKHETWIEKAILSEKNKSDKFDGLTDDEIKRLRREARIYFTEKCRYYAEIMGLEYKKISITSAKTRFGSCSSKKTICFSYRLMLYPPEARDYVVVHELAHLREMNHSPKFYEIIARYMPDYKERKKLLKN